MSDGNTISDPCPDPCPDPSPVPLSDPFSTSRIVDATTAFKAAVNALRKVKKSGDVDAVAGAEKNVKEYASDLHEECEEYILSVQPQVNRYYRDYRDKFKVGLDELSAAMDNFNLDKVRTDLNGVEDTFVTKAMRAYYTVWSARLTIEDTLKMLKM
jgi:hypothetical protein